MWYSITSNLMGCTSYQKQFKKCHKIHNVFLVLSKYLPLHFTGATTFPSDVWENSTMPSLNGILFKAQLYLNIFKSVIKHCYTNKPEPQDLMYIFPVAPCN